MNKAAQQLGSLGGKARAKSLSKKERSEIARKGGLAKSRKTKKASSVGHGLKTDSASVKPKLKGK